LIERKFFFKENAETFKLKSFWKTQSIEEANVSFPAAVALGAE
jgi:hypothetical protein